MFLRNRAIFLASVCLLSMTWTTAVLAKTTDAISFAVLMPAPAKKIHAEWKPLISYLSAKLNKPIKIITPKGLDQAKEALASADFVYANSYLYNLLKQTKSITPIAQMRNTDNSIYSRGRFLVKNSSNITKVEDLKGKKVALISPLGAGAYLAPKAYLNQRGVDIDKDVDVIFTKNLKKAAYMVLLGEADTAVMCDVSYGILSKKIDTGDLKFMDKTEDFPEALVFTPHNNENPLVKAFQKVLLEKNPDKDSALKSLNGMKIGNFIAYDPVVEKRISELKKAAYLEK